LSDYLRGVPKKNKDLQKRNSKGKRNPDSMNHKSEREQKISIRQGIGLEGCGKKTKGFDCS